MSYDRNVPRLSKFLWHGPDRYAEYAEVPTRAARLYKIVTVSDQESRDAGKNVIYVI